MKSFASGLFGALLCGASGLAISPAVAQEAAPQAGVGEIVVTARKRAESLQQTPITVTAVTAEEIEARNLSSILDLGAFTPNLSLSSGGVEIGSPANASFFIRGIGQSDYAPTTEPGVGLYVDGVYFARAAGAVLELGDIQQVEVLKGPQGTLFGKNTMGGAINVTTKRPVIGETEGSVGVTLGEDERFNADLDYNMPLGEKAAARFGLAYRSQEGFVDRPNAGDKVGDEGTLVSRLKLYFEPSTNTEILLAADYTHIDADAPTGIYPVYNTSGAGLVQFYNLFVGGPAGTPLTDAARSPDLYTDFGAGTNHSEYDGGGLSLRVEHDLDAVTLRSITAYRGFESRNQRDTDGSPANFNQTDYRDEQWQISQEFNLIGKAFDDRLDYTLGAYYFYEEADAAYRAILAEGLFAALEALPGAVVPLGPFACPGGPACAGGAGNPLNVAFDTDATDILSVESKSYALFGELEWAFTEQLSAFAGLRYTYDDKSYSVSFPQNNSGGFLVTPTSLEESWDDLSPRFGLKYQATPNLMMFGTFSKGYKAGGFNPRPGDNNAARVPFDPEQLTSYEIGAKSDWFDDRLRLNTAVFHYTYEDIQTYVADLLPGQTLPTQFIENIGEVRLWGVEADAIWAATERLTLAASIGYLNAEYTESAALLTGISEDTPIKKAPEWSATAAAQYRHPFAGGEMFYRVDYSYVDENYAEERALEPIKQKAHSLVNARIAFTSADEGWTLAAYGKNITDEEFIVNGFDARQVQGTIIAVPSEPRELGLQITRRF